MPINSVLPATLLLLLLTGSAGLAQADSQWDSAPQQTIQVEVTTHLGDQQRFHQGDRVSFLLSLEREAYVFMLYLDAAGDLVQLLPNRHQKIARYPAGVFMPIPSTESPFEFVIEAPFGSESVWLLASVTPWPDLEGEYIANGLFRPAATAPQILSRLYQHIRSTHSAFGQAKLHLHTQQ